MNERKSNSQGTVPARQILLNTERSEKGATWSDQHIQEAFGIGKSAMWRVHSSIAEQGLDGFLKRRPQPQRPGKRTLDREQETGVMALTRLPESPGGPGVVCCFGGRDASLMTTAPDSSLCVAFVLHPSLCPLRSRRRCTLWSTIISGRALL